MDRSSADRRYRQLLREAIQGQVPIEQLVKEVGRIHGPRNLDAIYQAIQQVVEGGTKRYTVRRGAAVDNVVEIQGEVAQRATAYWKRILLRSSLAILTDGDSDRADFLEGLLFVDSEYEWSDAPPQIDDYDSVRPVDKSEGEDSESLVEIMERLGFENEANSLHLWRSSLYHRPRWFEVDLHVADLVAQGYGVEAIQTDDGDFIATYVNMGDAYFPTILMPHVSFDEFEDREFYLIPWGDFFEAYEQHLAEEAEDEGEEEDGYEDEV